MRPRGEKKMGLTRVTVALRASQKAKKVYRTEFLVDTGATDSLAPASKLRAAGIKPIGKITYELADGTPKELAFGLAVIEFMGDVTAGRVIFGPEGVEPILGVTALESTGIAVNPKDQTLKRLPAIPLKRAACLDKPGNRAYTHGACHPCPEGVPYSLPPSWLV